jgi:KDO2-lipid IV(A) lauroyltransferase
MLFILFGKSLSLFGFNYIKYTSKILAYLFYNIVRLRRSVVIRNLTKAFPNLSEKEINSIAHKNYVSIARTFLELFLIPKLSREEISALFTINNLELIHKKKSEGRGLILLTAHYGNWELAAIATGIQLSTSINVLVKEQSNPFVTKWLKSVRENFGNKEIPLGISVKEIFKSLKNDKIVGVVGDQRGPKDGVKVNFLGTKTSTFIGTASIALKLKSPVLVLFSIRKPDGKYEGVIEEICLEDLQGDNEQMVREFNQKYVQLLENVIVQNPEQWFWMHNIWKY